MTSSQKLWGLIIATELAVGILFITGGLWFGMRYTNKQIQDYDLKTVQPALREQKQFNREAKESFDSTLIYTKKSLDIIKEHFDGR